MAEWTPTWDRSMQARPRKAAKVWTDDQFDSALSAWSAAIDKGRAEFAAGQVRQSKTGGMQPGDIIRATQPTINKIKDPMSESELSLVRRWLIADPTLARNPHYALTMARMGIDPESDDGMQALRRMQGKNVRDNITWENPIMDALRWGTRAITAPLSSIKQAADVFIGTPGRQDWSDVWAATDVGGWLTDRENRGIGQSGSGWFWGGQAAGLSGYKRAEITPTAFWTETSGPNIGKGRTERNTGEGAQDWTMGLRWMNWIAGNHQWNSQTVHNPDEWYMRTGSGLVDATSSLVLDPSSYIGAGSVSKAGRLIMRIPSGRAPFGAIKAGETVIEGTARQPARMSAANAARLMEPGGVNKPAIVTPVNRTVRDLALEGSKEKNLLREALNSGTAKPTDNLKSLVTQGRTSPRATRDRIIAAAGLDPALDDRSMAEALQGWAKSQPNVDTDLMHQIVDHARGRQINNMSNADVALAVASGGRWARRAKVPAKKDAADNLYTVMYRMAHLVTGDVGLARTATETAMQTKGTIHEAFDILAGATGHADVDTMVKEALAEVAAPRIGTAVRNAEPELRKFVDTYSGRMHRVDASNVKLRMGWTDHEYQVYMGMLADSRVVGAQYWGNIASKFDETRPVLATQRNKGHALIDNMIDNFSGVEKPLRNDQAWSTDVHKIMDNVFQRGSMHVDDVVDATGLDRPYVARILQGLVDRDIAAVDEAGNVTIAAADEAGLQAHAFDVEAEARSVANDKNSIRFHVRPGSAEGSLHQRVVSQIAGTLDNGWDAAYGLARDGDFAIIEKDVQKFFDSRGGRGTMSALANAHTFEQVTDMLPDAPAAVRLMLSNAKDPDEVRSVLAQAIGTGELTHYPYVGSLRRFPGAVTRPQPFWEVQSNPLGAGIERALNVGMDRGRHARGYLAARQVSLDDTEELLTQAERMFTSARVPLGPDRQEIYNALLTATSMKDRRMIMTRAVSKTIEGHMLQRIGDRRAQRAWRDAAEKRANGATLSRREERAANRWEAVQEAVRLTTRVFKDTDGLATSYGLVADTSMGIDAGAGKIGGKFVDVQDPAMLSQLAGRTMPTLDSRDLARMTSRTGAMTRYIMAHPGLSRDKVGKAAYRAARVNDMISNVYAPMITNLWKASVLMRASYVARNVIEEWQRVWTGGWGGLSQWSAEGVRAPKNMADAMWMAIGVGVDRGTTQWMRSVRSPIAEAFGREGGSKFALGVTGERLSPYNLSDPYAWRENMNAASGMASVAKQLDSVKSGKWRAAGSVTNYARAPGTDALSPVELAYAEGLAHHLSVFSKDPVMGRLAGGWSKKDEELFARNGVGDDPTERMMFWLRSTKSGNWVAKQLGGMTIPARGPNGTVMQFDLTDSQSMRQFVGWMEDNLFYRTLGQDKLRQMVATGQTPNGRTFLNHDGRPHPDSVKEIRDHLTDISQDTFNQFDAAEVRWFRDTPTGSQQKKLDLVDKFFHIMGDVPTDALVRVPQFRVRYWQNMKSLGGHMHGDEKVEVLTGLARDKTLPGNELRDLASAWGVKRGKDGSWTYTGGKRNIPDIGRFDREAVDEIARRMSTQDIRKMFYQHAERQHVFDMARFIAPFAQPTWNSLSKVSNLLLNNPRALGRTLAVMEGAQQPGSSDIYRSLPGFGGYGYDPGKGFLHTDESGDTKFAYPFLGDVYQGLAQAVGLPKSNLAAESYAQGLNLSLDPHPGLGPLGTLPLSAMSNTMFSDPKFDSIRNMIWPTVSEQRTGVETGITSFMPAYVNKFMTAFGVTNGQKNALAKRQTEMIAYLASTGEYDTSSETDTARMLAEAQRMAKWMFLLEGAQRLAIPTPTTTSATPSLKTKDGDNKTMRFLSDELWRLRDVTGDYTTGTQLFWDAYGDHLYFVGATGKSGTSGMATADNNTDLWLRGEQGANEQFAAAFPHTWGLFVPVTTDPALLAYNARARDKIASLGGQDYSHGAAVRDLHSQMLGDMLFQRELRTRGITEDAPISERRGIEQKISELVPGWNSKLGITLGTAEERQEELFRAAAERPGVASDLVLEYKDRYDAAVAAYRAQKLKDAEDGKGVTEKERDQAENAQLDKSANATSQYRWELLQWGDEQARLNDQFGQMWRRVLRKGLV